MVIEDMLQELPWDPDPKIGWWRDNDPIRLYHGTHISRIRDIAASGLVSSTGWVSLAVDPYTARGYASMTGGESEFRKAGKRARHAPMEERAVLVIEAPLGWLLENYDPSMGGNIGTARARMTDKSLYDDYDGSDYSYYALTELRVRDEVPPEYIVGYMTFGSKKPVVDNGDETLGGASGDEDPLALEFD